MRLTLILAAIVLLSPLQAETTGDVRASTSVSYLATEKSPVDLNSAEVDIMPALEKFGFRDETGQQNKVIQSKSCGCDISVFNATTILLSDDDNDGFYHRIKVIVDADSDPGHGAWVYAKLYLSFEGGPWNHYATSGDFFVEGPTDLDEFVVETELSDGFPTGYYDIRIELYDADFNDWLDTYGPNDDGSLNAIPLEDAERDDDYSHGIHGGGGVGFWLLAALSLLGLGRLWSVFRQA